EDLQRDLVADRPQRYAVERAAADEQETAERIRDLAQFLVEEDARDHAEEERDETAPGAGEARVAAAGNVAARYDDIGIGPDRAVDEGGDRFGRMLQVAVHNADVLAARDI